LADQQFGAFRERRRIAEAARGGGQPQSTPAE
jgi:hypothetical protein